MDNTLNIEELELICSQVKHTCRDVNLKNSMLYTLPKKLEEILSGIKELERLSIDKDIRIFIVPLKPIEKGSKYDLLGELAEQLKSANSLIDKAFLYTEEIYKTVVEMKTDENKKCVSSAVNSILDFKNVIVYNQLVLSSVIRILKFLSDGCQLTKPEEKNNGKKH